jgi:hypothetical protein
VKPPKPEKAHIDGPDSWNSPYSGRGRRRGGMAGVGRGIVISNSLAQQLIELPENEWWSVNPIARGVLQLQEVIATIGQKSRPSR